MVALFRNRVLVTFPFAVRRGGFEVDGRRCLYEANREKWPPDRLFRVMAQHVPKLYAPYLLTKNGKKRPLVSPGPSPNSKRMILFTDSNLSRVLRVDQSVTLMERRVTDLLRRAFRSGFDGLVINPGDSSRRVIHREEMHRLFREYAVVEGRRLGGGWVPTQGDKMLLIELEDGAYTVTAYIDERDAREVCDSCGGEPVLHPWDVIADRCLQSGAKAPYLQFGFPEQVLLLPRHMNELQGKGQEIWESGETKECLERLDQAVRMGQGWVNSREIIRRMAELRKIWVIVDPDGKPAFLDFETRVPVVDFFTSRDRAIRLIKALQQRGKELPGMEPRLVDARPLFKRLAAYEPIVWINRGAPEGWTSVSNGLLPAVLSEGPAASGATSGADR